MTTRNAPAQTGGNNIDVKETEGEKVDWTKLAHDGDKWRAVVKAIMAIWGP